jgi:succinyl-CoA synthetase alpha subunit
VGTSFVEALEWFGADPDTKAVVLIGEIGGSAEEDAARYIARSLRKPVVSYIAGRTAPPGKRMGHAGAVISGGLGTAEAKLDAMREAGITVVEGPHLLGKAMKELLAKRGKASAAASKPKAAPAKVAAKGGKRK